MRVVCCCDGDETATLVQHTIRTLHDIRSLSIISCIDSRDRDDVGMIHGSVLGSLRLGQAHTDAISAAEQQRTAEIFAEAAAAARSSGYQGEFETRLYAGRPERAIVQYLLESQADAVTLFPRPPRHRQPPGPRSIGHVARYVIDHAPCAVLLFRA
jgi:nucleotide-binding universal stress UspA family protein